MGLDSTKLTLIRKVKILWSIVEMYSGLQNCVSILSIMMFDIIEKVLNFELNPYISSMTIDESCTQFCKAVYSGLQKGMSIVSIIIFNILEKILNFY